MKFSCFSIFSALFLSGSIAQASSITINFDNVSAGTLATAAAPGGIEFFQAHYVNDVDAYGDEISNTAKWQVDTENNTSTPVTVENPQLNSYGIAPSGHYSLDARWQPVLVHFDQAKNLSDFSVTLDNSIFGDVSLTSLFFLNGNKDIIGILNIDQTQPGLIAGITTPLWGVQEIVLPAGAFYDDLVLTTVPVPASLQLMLGALGIMGFIARRKRQ